MHTIIHAQWDDDIYKVPRMHIYKFSSSDLAESCTSNRNTIHYITRKGGEVTLMYSLLTKSNYATWSINVHVNLYPHTG